MKARYLKYALLCACLLCFGAAIIIYPERYVNCCAEGFLLWAECVLPSLFPFMIIALILIKTGIADRASLPLKRAAKVLNMPQTAGICFVLSILSGYPAGSRVLSEFYEGGALTSGDCDKIAPLCSTSGPLFIIGSVGYKMFGDKLIGVKIFIAHAVAVTIFSVIYCLFCKRSNEAPQRRPLKSGNILYDTFYGAVISVAVAGGFIAFFYVFAQFLQDFKVFLPLEKLFCLFLSEGEAKALCMGIAEVTTGCRFLAGAGGKFFAPLAGFMITFGGISILLQQLGYLVKTGVKPVKFVSFKFLQGVICFLILLVIA